MRIRPPTCRTPRFEAAMGALAALLLVSLAALSRVPVRTRPAPDPTVSVAAAPSAATPQPQPVAPDAYPGVDTVTFVDAQRGWAAGPGVILGTSDGGASWVRQYDGTAWPTKVDVLPDGRHGWAMTDGGLLHTVDGGRSWIPVAALANPTAPASGLVLGEVAFVTATDGWGIGEMPPGHPTLLHTADSGAIWAAAPSPGTAPPAAPPCFGDPAHGWIGMGGTVYHTSDGGRTWATAYTPPRPVQQPVDVRLTCGPGWVWALFSGRVGIMGTEYLLVRDTADGPSWTPVLGDWGPVPAALPRAPQAFINAFAAASGNVVGLLTVCGPCGPQQSMVTISADGGRSWRTHVAGACCGSALALADARHAWVTFGGGNPPGRLILATSDGGVSWVRQWPPPPAPSASNVR